MVQLEATCTKKTATPSNSPFLIVVVMATAGHMDNARRKMGFSASNPLRTSSKFVFFVATIDPLDSLDFP